jgi:hypothetical protein
MKLAKFSLLSLFFYTAISFAVPLPVPVSKAAYIGDWQGKDTQLKISADGKIFYKRSTPEKQVNLSIDLASFDGNNFVAGVGIIKSTFHVTKPPTKSGDKINMTVDGVELTKVD